MQETSFVLYLKPCRMHAWNLEFDSALKAYARIYKQRKKVKITAEMVRTIIKAAGNWKESKKTIRLKKFTSYLNEEYDIELNSKSVGDILVANDLRKKSVRKKRPRFYQSLRQNIPNGLLSVDGSEFVIHLDDESYKFNVEFAVDVTSNLCTSFSVSGAESSGEVLKVLEDHRLKWGPPLGFLSDHGSANLNERLSLWLTRHDVQAVPAGPANPKGNGTVEGSFGWMKRIAGDIRIDMSSERSIAQSVLETIIDVYMKMHCRLPVGGAIGSRAKSMAIPVDIEARQLEKERLLDYLKSKIIDDNPKLYLLRGMITSLHMNPDMKVLKRAEKTIVHYDLKAVRKAEAVFVKAVSRKKGRLNLAYFFGILKRIQQEYDDNAYADYYRKRYNYDQMIESRKREEERCKAEEPADVESIVGMFVKSVTEKARYLRELTKRTAIQWLDELKKTIKYSGPLYKKFMNVIAELKDISLDQKMEIQQQIKILLPIKNCGVCVT